MSGKPEVSLNLHVRGIEQSATLAINARSIELIKQGRKVYRMGLGQSPFPVPQSVVDSLKMHAHEKDYLPVEGLWELREAVAGFHRKKDAVDMHPEQVLVGPGSKELMFLLQLCFYGEIILPTPSWVSYLPQAHIIGRPVKFIETTFENRWKIKPEQLIQLLENQRDINRPRVVVLNYPANPDGCTYERDELKALADIGRAYNLIFLSDEIYGMLHFEGEHISLAKYYPEGTIISSGLSKWCGAGGWRLGTFSFPTSLKWLMDSMAATASETYTSVSAPIQYAAVRAFQANINIERYLWRTRKILNTLVTKCVEILQGGNVRVQMPDGAFYLFIDCEPFREKLMRKGITNGRQMCEQLLVETGIAILPGSSFNRPDTELTARIALVNFDGARAMAKCETIPMDQPLPKEFLRYYCGDTVKAMKLLTEWLDQ